MKTYYLTLSKVFPATHRRAGEQTNFEAAFHAGQVSHLGSERIYRYPKLHTIRAKYEFWEKRFVRLGKGEACLAIRQWTGTPYRGRQLEIARLTREDGIGLQRMSVIGCTTIHPIYIDGHSVKVSTLAHNDGLDETDWRNWFEGYDLTEPMAVIQFTNFRYK